MTLPCLFGLESFVSRELKSLGITVTTVEDGRVSFLGGWEELIKANLWVRTGERVLIKMAEFDAVNFDDFYEGVKNAPWNSFLPANAQLPISGHCLKSRLSSPNRCRAIIKKAIADKMAETSGISWLPEDGAVYQIRFTVMKDKVSVYIDSTGEGLHKRGYRQMSNAAPLRETIAAAMVILSRWRREDVFADPFCGSGTIPIEAALYKRNIAPGLKRSFAFESFDAVSPELTARLREEAAAAANDLPLEIIASDIEPSYVELSAENARLAGVGDVVKPTLADARCFTHEASRGTIICNPPYGERLSDAAECEILYNEIGKAFRVLDNWAYFILASSEDFERQFGRKADKQRKVYNGMKKCRIYQYFSVRK